MLVATAIISVIMLVGVWVVSQVSSLTGRTVEQAKAFQSARLAFDLLTRNLGQATLNTYSDYADQANKFPSDPGYNDRRPMRYARRSDLHFVCDLAGKDADFPGLKGAGSAVFFQAHLGFTGSSASYGGLDQLLTVCGYYIDFGDDTSRPAHAPSAPKYRYRLRQLLVPSQNVSIFKLPGGSLNWFEDFKSDTYPMADNVIALIVRAQYPSQADPKVLTTVYSYNSRDKERDNPQPVTANQLPPTLQVTMVAIDESSARRLDRGATPPPAITSALTGKFTDVTQYQSDLDELKDALVQNRITFQVYSSAVAIRESKWSK